MVALSDTPPAAQSRFFDPAVIQRLLKTVDFVVMILAAIAGMATTGLLGDAYGNTLASFSALLLASVVLYALRTAGLYRVRALVGGWRPVAVSLALCLAVGFGLDSILSLISALPLGWSLIWAPWAGGWIVLSRFGLMPLMRNWELEGRFTRRIAIVGGGEDAEKVISILERSALRDVSVVGLFDDRDDERSPSSVRRHTKIGRISELADFARSDRIDLIVVTIPPSAERRLLYVLKRLWELPVDIRISAHGSKLKLTPRSYAYVGDLPLLSVFDRPLSGWDAFMKAMFDRVVAALLIALLSPVLLAIGAAVRLESRGPAIFRQKRYGFNNELITVFKFRSMFADKADAKAEKLVTRDDPRVTRLGRFIRKTSLDELPQLFNVVRGDMSLVGPRPHAIAAKADNQLYEQVVEGYFARHRIKPGITGWAQVNGYRGETDTRDKIENRVKYDLDYIDRWSIPFDIYILAITPLSLLSSESAY